MSFINEDTLVAFVINARTDGESGYEFWLKMNDRELSADGLYTYLSSALGKITDRSQPAIQFLEILISVVEQIKADHPAIAASVRQMNIQHRKGK